VTGYSNRGLHGQVVHELGTRIVSGRLTSGTTLELPAVEAELGVSRTVLRESLKVLAAKGLVGARQKRGTFVTPRAQWNMLDADVLRWQIDDEPTTALLGQLAEVRWIVEPAGAALAAVRRTGADLDALDDALRAMGEHDDAPGVVDADLAFHAALLGATHNVLLESLENVIEQGLRQRDVLVHSQPDAPDPVPAHRAVLDAVRAADPAGAELAMRSLLEQASADHQALDQQALERRSARRGRRAAATARRGAAR
jgi:GntR family transcriptional regulator, galactonate operon transcriptional repressor